MFGNCTSLQNIKMPNKMNAEANINLSDLSLPSQNASKEPISWYSLSAGDGTGTAVDASASVSNYANKVLTINQGKSYEQINKDVFGNGADTPETPSTGVVLDVVLPAFSIVLVLASLCAVAFVGKKKKQF